MIRIQESENSVTLNYLASIDFVCFIQIDKYDNVWDVYKKVLSEKQILQMEKER